jgi:hypothetical protein
LSAANETSSDYFSPPPNTQRTKLPNFVTAMWDPRGADKIKRARNASRFNNFRT